MNIKILVCSFLCLTASACSITQTVEPADIPKGKELCILEDSSVREGFLAEFQSILASKGIAHRLIRDTKDVRACEWTATYLARWSWDWTIYMSYAEIKIYHNGALDGEAIYDSRSGGGNLGKFIDAEPKIRELVNELLKRQAALSEIYKGLAPNKSL